MNFLWKKFPKGIFIKISWVLDGKFPLGIFTEKFIWVLKMRLYGSIFWIALLKTMETLFSFGGNHFEKKNWNHFFFFENFIEIIANNAYTKPFCFRVINLQC